MPTGDFTCHVCGQQRCNGHIHPAFLNLPATDAYLLPISMTDQSLAQAFCALTLGKDDVLFVQLGKMPDNPQQGVKMLSQLTQTLQSAFSGQMGKVVVIPHDMSVTRVTNPPLNVQWTKTDSRAVAPVRAKKGDAGYDLVCYDEVVIRPGERYIVDTGVAMAIPEGWYGSIRDRSGLAAKDGLTVLGGVVDSGYRGSIRVVLHNTRQGDEGETVRLAAGSRVAQILFERCGDAVLEEVAQLDETERAATGFGSSGV